MPVSQPAPLDLGKPSRIQQIAFLSCPVCSADHQDATTWAVQAIAGETAPVITALICPSCDHEYRVMSGAVNDVPDSQLRVFPRHRYRILIFLLYLIGGYGVWKLLQKLL
jgi:hypothetical protein